MLACAVEVLPVAGETGEAAARLYLGPTITARGRQLERLAQHALRRHYLAAIAQDQRQFQGQADLGALVAAAFVERLTATLESGAIPAHRGVIVEALARGVGGPLEQRHRRRIAGAIGVVGDDDG